jgi:hypothetical protein
MCLLWRFTGCKADLGHSGHSQICQSLGRSESYLIQCMASYVFMLRMSTTNNLSAEPQSRYRHCSVKEVLHSDLLPYAHERLRDKVETPCMLAR